MAIWGCIADDFTGASDAASFLRKGGMKVRLFNGVPKKIQNCEADDAWVIALKTRTEEKTQAVRHFICESGSSCPKSHERSSFDSYVGQPDCLPYGKSE